jgi:hypothetical protein
MSRIKSLSKYFSRQEAVKGENLRKSNNTESVMGLASGEGLKFLFRLDSEAFLIGNSRQLDAISLSVVEDYIESEQLWTWRPKSAILKLLVDDRSRPLLI